jgi:hypothetical protein
MGYLQRQSEKRKLRMDLKKKERSHKEHNTTERIDIAHESWSFRIIFDSNDFRRPPSRIETAFGGGRIQLQLPFSFDCC